MSDLLKRFTERPPALMRHLGIELDSVTPERVIGRMKAADFVGNGNNVVHGGAYMAFADHLGAIGTIANLPKGATTATIESKTNFFAPGKLGGYLHGESVPLHRGKRTNVWQTRITDDEGKLLAQVTQTQIVMVREPKPD